MILSEKVILITEDNSINRITFMMSLMLEGARVEFNRFGQGTVRAVSRLRNIDLIILDLMLMRGTSGYEQFKELRQIPELAHVPIIAVSAAEPIEAIAKCKDLGFSGFIPKPIDEREFPSQVARIINGEEIWLSR